MGSNLVHCHTFYFCSSGVKADKVDLYIDISTYLYKHFTCKTTAPYAARKPCKFLYVVRSRPKQHLSSLKMKSLRQCMQDPVHILS